MSWGPMHAGAWREVEERTFKWESGGIISLWGLGSRGQVAPVAALDSHVMDTDPSAATALTALHHWVADSLTAGDSRNGCRWPPRSLELAQRLPLVQPCPKGPFDGKELGTKKSVSLPNSQNTRK